MINAAQSKAARALLDWSQSRLAEEAGLSESTVRDFEKGRRMPSTDSLAKIEEALEVEGVSFIANGTSSRDGGVGVRFTHRDNVGDLDGRIGEVETLLEILSQKIADMEERVKEEVEDDKPDSLAISAYTEILIEMEILLKRRERELFDLMELRSKLQDDDV